MKYQAYHLFFFFLLLLFSGTSSAQELKLKVFTEIPGRDSSVHYHCRVRPVGDTAWKEVFVLETKSKTVSSKEQQQTTKYTEHLSNWTASWISFEFAGTAVEVEISKANGNPIQKAKVRPEGHASAARIENGKAYVTFEDPANVNVDIDGQLEDQYTGMGYSGPPVNSMSIFANPIYHEPDTNHSKVYALEPGEAIPDRSVFDTLYFKPGVHEIGVPYPVNSYKTYYIPGDAVVHGTLRFGSTTSNVSVYGSGVLSGENITREEYGDDNARPIHGTANTARFEGIVIPDPAHHTVILGNSSSDPQKANVFDRVKILGWRVNGDGIHMFSNGEVVNCFIRTQDDATYYSRTVHIHKTVFWNDFNGAVVRVVKGDNTAGTSSFKDNVVIYHRASWHYWSGGRVVAFRDAGPGKTIKNVLIRNILIEDPFPAFPPFWFTMDATGDGTLKQVMENVWIENVYQQYPGVSSSQDETFGKPRNTMQGLNTNNKFSNITFKHCYFNGKWLGSFEDGDFAVNDYIQNITFIEKSLVVVSLAVQHNRGGTVSGAGQYSMGEEIVLKAYSDPGYMFSGWTNAEGDTVSEDPLYAVTLDNDLDLTAHFERLPDLSTVVFATNCGGAAYEATDGTLYSADQLFSGGGIYPTSPETYSIGGTDEDVLYSSERHGSSFSYAIPLENREYMVTLMFAEIFWDNAGSRLFNVDLEGSTVISNLDIYGEVGKYYAYIEEHNVTLSDGVLNIDFSTITDGAKISAIKVAIPGNSPSYDLVTNASNGSVMLSPPGGTYDSLQTVILTAVANPGYRLSGWTGDLSGSSNPESISMVADMTVTALFEQIPVHTLTTESVHGSIVLDPAGGTYDEGTIVSLTAIPDEGYRFLQWNGDLTGEENPVSIEMSSGKHVSATFEIIQYFALATNISNGTITRDPAGEVFEKGQQVKLSVIPDDRYRFTGWSGDLSGTANPATIVMDGDKTVTAEMEKYLYTLEVIATNGSVSVYQKRESYTPGTGVVLQAVPDEGYIFSHWEGDLTGNENPTSIIMDDDKVITAVFSTIIGINDFPGGHLPGNSLGQNHPNPFTISTFIPYQLSKQAHVELSVYDLTGQKVAVLVDGEQPAGYHQMFWKATDHTGGKMAAGIYLYRLVLDHQDVFVNRFFIVE